MNIQLIFTKVSKVIEKVLKKVFLILNKRYY